MNNHDTSTARRAPPGRGGLSTEKPDGVLLGERLLPPASLAPFVHHLWALEWDLRSPHRGEALPHPAARIVFANGPTGARARVEGVFTTRRSVSRTAHGEELGIQFRPVAFQGLLGRSMATLTDRAVPLEEIFGSAGAVWTKQLFAAHGPDEMLALVTTFLSARLAPLSDEALALRDAVERLAADRSLLRVEGLAAAVGLDARALQRRFLRYVGVSPKWVLQRYRMLEAAEQLKAPKPPALVALADALGYADQAHFARDFKRVIGRAPGAFARPRGQ